MNQSLLDLEFHVFNDINLFQKYEICRQQSPCYLLNPPPQLPIFPKLILNNPPSTLTHLRQRTDSFFIIFGIFITLISICLLLFLLNIKFQFYYKLKQRYRRTKKTNITNESSLCSSIVPTFYNSLTPLTITTNQSSYKSNLNLQQHFNIYEEIRLSSDHHYCSHTLAYYQQTPYYYTYELSPSKIVCQNCLLETLHRKKQCLCHHFFVPIK